MRLTDIAVRNLPAPDTGAKVHYDDGLKGFGVRVSQAGTKAFVLVVGEERERLTIGRYGIITLAEARTEAKRILAERTLGKRQPPKMTLGGALDLFGEQHLAKLAPRTEKEGKRLFTKYLTPLRSKKLADVTTHHITAITDDIKPSEGEHLHKACKTFFRWCVRRRLLQHSPIEGLELPSKWKPRERVLNDEELRALWKKLKSTEGSFANILRMLLLTGQRRGEIAALKAEWCSLPPDCELKECASTENVPAPFQSTICLPSSITKNRREHTFPIGETAVALLQSLGVEKGPYFSFNAWSKSKATLDESVKIEPWTVHDLRRTYATNLQRLKVPLEVIEALLNHISGTRAGIVGVYQRHKYFDEMAEAVDKFEEWFQRVIITEYGTQNQASPSGK